MERLELEVRKLESFASHEKRGDWLVFYAVRRGERVWSAGS
jgi:hypothetical protein